MHLPAHFRTVRGAENQTVLEQTGAMDPDQHLENCEFSIVVYLRSLVML